MLLSVFQRVYFSAGSSGLRIDILQFFGCQVNLPIITVTWFTGFVFGMAEMGAVVRTSVCDMVGDIGTSDWTVNTDTFGRSGRIFLELN